MPELPDIVLYQSALQRFLGGKPIESISVRSPFLVRTFDPELQSCVRLRIKNFERIGKRIVWCLDDDLFLVFHLMIAGRFHWKKPGVKPARKVDLAAFGFEHGTLLVTEAGTKKRASLHVIRGRASLKPFDRGGLEVLECSLAEFRDRLRKENHTLKRALTDPRLFSGIGNAYSDEILHAAGMSPVQLTSRLTDEQIAALFEATTSQLAEWSRRLNEQVGDRFPEKVTAFRPDMAVHGRFGERCPACGHRVQRIVYAARETNYCSSCQTGGKVLKDRSLSRLLKDDWPKTIEELEEN